MLKIAFGIGTVFVIGTVCLRMFAILKLLAKLQIQCFALCFNKLITGAF